MRVTAADRQCVVVAAAATRCTLGWRLHVPEKISELIMHVTVLKNSTALAEKGLLRGFRLRSLSQRAALRTNLFVSPRKSVSSIQTKRLHREGPDNITGKTNAPQLTLFTVSPDGGSKNQKANETTFNVILLLQAVLALFCLLLLLRLPACPTSPSSSSVLFYAMKRPITQTARQISACDALCMSLSYSAGEAKQLPPSYACR